MNSENSEEWTLITSKGEGDDAFGIYLSPDGRSFVVRGLVLNEEEQEYYQM